MAGACRERADIDVCSAIRETFEPPDVNLGGRTSPMLHTTLFLEYLSRIARTANAEYVRVLRVD